MFRHLVSIIIPCYRQAHLLPQAIKSCLEQSYPHLEIIVVDDGSPDNVVKVLERFKSKFIYIRQENQGLSAARNTGLAKAKGAFIKFLDSDDWLLPHCVEHQLYSLNNLHKHVSVIGHSLYFEDSSRPSEDIYPEFGKLIHKLCYVNTGPPHTYLFPTDSVRDIGGFDTSSRVDGGHEDYDLLCRLALKGFDVVALHAIGCIYRQSSDSMSTHLETMQRSRSRVWQHFATQNLQTACKADMLLHLLGGYSLRLASGDFRYEATAILNDIHAGLKQSSNSISHTSATALCNHITLLRNNLPRSRDKHEASCRELSIDISDDLMALALEKIVNGPLLTISHSKTLLELTKSHLWIERGHRFRRIFTKIQSIPISSTLLKKVYSIIAIPSYFKKKPPDISVDKPDK